MEAQIVYLCLQATRQGQASHAHVHEVVRGLRNLGYQVRLFEPDEAGRRIPGLIGKACDFVSVQVTLWRHCPQPDIVYVRAHPAALMTALWAKVKGIPVVQEVNGPYEDVFDAYPWMRAFGLPLRFCMRIPLKLADSLFVVTPQLREWARNEVGPKPTLVVPNGADTQLFRPGVPLERNLPRPYMVFFGAFARWQGLETLLRAVEEPAWPRGVSLVLAGDGIERIRVQNAAAGNPSIVYLGTVPYRELPSIVSNSLAGIVPKTGTGGHSRIGLSPLKVYETLACGVPVVVTDLPHQADIVREGKCGLVVPTQDPTALARAAAHLHEHAAEREAMGRRGRAVVQSSHSWSHRVASMEPILRSLASSGSAQV